MTPSLLLKGKHGKSQRLSMPWILCRTQIPYDWKRRFVCGFHWKSPFSQLTWEGYMIVFERGPASYTRHSLFRSWHSALCERGIPWSICELKVQLDPGLQDVLMMVDGPPSFALELHDAGNKIYWIHLASQVISEMTSHRAFTSNWWTIFH